MKRLHVRTLEREQLIDITDPIRAVLRDAGLNEGIVYLWALHTTCALTVNEGFDPDVATDVVRALRRVFPRANDYLHAEGNSDAHLKTAMLGSGLTLLVEEGDLVLGTWQRVFLAEWDGPRTREVALRLIPAGPVG